MPTDNLNIEALLDFSTQQDDLIKGHQKEMQQVLRNKEQLRTALALEHAQKLTLEQEKAELIRQIEQLKAEKAQLLAENKELKERPNIVPSSHPRIVRRYMQIISTCMRPWNMMYWTALYVSNGRMELRSPSHTALHRM